MIQGTLFSIENCPPMLPCALTEVSHLNSQTLLNGCVIIDITHFESDVDNDQSERLIVRKQSNEEVTHLH